MHVNDLINSTFECLGAVAQAFNVRQLVKDRKVAGVSLPVVGFFTGWGLWNMIYYPSLGQWYSAAACAFLCAGNLVWVFLAIHYRHKKRHPSWLF